MAESRLAKSVTTEYFRRRMAEERELAKDSRDPQAREVHERAVRIFRELLEGRDARINH